MLEKGQPVLIDGLKVRGLLLQGSVQRGTSAHFGDDVFGRRFSSDADIVLLVDGELFQHEKLLEQLEEWLRSRIKQAGENTSVQQAMFWDEFTSAMFSSSQFTFVHQEILSQDGQNQKGRSIIIYIYIYIYIFETRGVLC